MSKEGYISLHRTLLDNPIFNSEPYTKGQAWVAILMLTNHKEGYITVKNGKMIKIERGECGFSELALSDIFKWSRGKVKRFLILLESEKMIQQKIVENHSIIKILNYEKFQNSTTNDTTNDTTNGQQTVQQTDINNNDNNDNNDNKYINNNNKENFSNFEKPTKEEIKKYANQQLGKSINNVDEFISWYDAQGWLDNNGFPINWKQKVQSWIKRNQSYNQVDINKQQEEELDGWSL